MDNEKSERPQEYRGYIKKNNGKTLEDVFAYKYKDMFAEKTCAHAPEQYDVYTKDGKRIGYFRFEWGLFTCENPNNNFEVLFRREAKGIYDFEDNEERLDAFTQGFETLIKLREKDK